MDSMIERVHKLMTSVSFTELEEVIAMMQRERAGKLDEARSSLRAEFEAKAASIGLTASQIFGQSHSAQGKPKRGQQSAPAPVKFRSPAGQTWSGRGRKPLWLTQAEAAGQTAEEFRVHE